MFATQQANAQQKVAQSTQKVQTFDVFCGGLPEWITKPILEELARGFNHKKTKVLFNSKGTHQNAFVTFTSVEDAKCFIKAFNGNDPLNCGEPFVARFADGKNGGRKKIHVGKLAPGTTEDDLETMGSQFGTVLSVKLLEAQACGFIVFSTQAEAQACVDAHAESPFVVEFAKCGGKDRGNKEAPAMKRRSHMSRASTVESMNTRGSMLSRGSTFSRMGSFSESPQNVQGMGGMFPESMTPAMTPAMSRMGSFSMGSSPQDQQAHMMALNASLSLAFTMPFGQPFSPLTSCYNTPEHTPCQSPTASQFATPAATPMCMSPSTGNNSFFNGGFTPVVANVDQFGNIVSIQQPVMQPQMVMMQAPMEMQPPHPDRAPPAPQVDPTMNMLQQMEAQQQKQHEEDIDMSHIVHETE